MLRFVYAFSSIQDRASVIAPMLEACCLKEPITTVAISDKNGFRDTMCGSVDDGYTT